LIQRYDLQPDRVALALRRTCEGLARRADELRAFRVSVELNRLQSEREALEQRLTSAASARVIESLRGALQALEQQRQQFFHLQQEAEQVDAEITRLSLILENLSTQLMRLKRAGEPVSTASDSLPDPMLETSVLRLQEEVQAITEALEDLQTEDRDNASRARHR
jgi:seryl-tRNA synthetase